jgi:starch-binding outer membrane protein, SusD/RagB family
MKTITTKSIIFLFAGLLAVTSCDFLELESPNDLDADNYFTKPEHAENALIGLYSTLQSPSYYGGNYLLISEPLCGNSVTGGFDNINVDEFGFKAVTSTNIIVEEMWYSIYNVVANSNRLITGLERVPGLDPARKDEIEGQARFIRALAHFDLLRYFGEHWNTASQYGVPVVDEVQKIGDVEPRATVSNSYNFIITELENALTLVNPDERDQAFVNASTVRALLARVYLYNKNYAKAIENATAVIDDSSYGLLSSDSYGAIFTERNTSESIFELAFDGQNRSRYNGLTYSRPEALNTEVNFLAAEELNEFFATRTDDVRAALVDVDPDNNDTSIQPNGRTQKYRGEATEDNPAYILRLAEMYLIRAEALGFANNGIDDINALRNARGLANGSAATADEFKILLLDEIRAEFNFEGHYYFNLARIEEIKPGGVVDTEAFRAILPVPLREITATNEVVSQNPGY